MISPSCTIRRRTLTGSIATLLAFSLIVVQFPTDRGVRRNVTGMPESSTKKGGEVCLPAY